MVVEFHREAVMVAFYRGAVVVAFWFGGGSGVGFRATPAARCRRIWMAGPSLRCRAGTKSLPKATTS